MWSSTGTLASAGLFFGLLVGAAITPEPDRLPIDLVSIEFLDGGALRYERDVLASEIIVARVERDIIDVKTEQRVDGCKFSAERDFGPDEPRVQTFPLGDACLSALQPGVKYQPFAAVIPLVGKPDAVRGDTFVWAGK